MSLRFDICAYRKVFWTSGNNLLILLGSLKNLGLAQFIWNAEVSNLVNERVQIFRVRVESGYQTFESEPGPCNFQIFYVESGYYNFESGLSLGNNIMLKMGTYWNF